MTPSQGTTKLLRLGVFRKPTLQPTVQMGRRLATDADIKETLPEPLQQTDQRFQSFQLRGKVFAVTGGGRGLGLTMAGALVEAGGEVHCLDRLPEPHEEFYTAQARANPQFGGSLHYHPLDVRDRDSTNQILSAIADGKNRLDGLIAAAGVNHVESAINHSAADIERIISINYTGAFTSATAAATQMLNKQCRGSILLVSSMSGTVANKGMKSSIYNSSKAAVIQLTRSFAIEWSNIDREGRGGIRVNCLCPGDIITPMARMVMDKTPGDKGDMGV
ncbi:unnamed protein product [Penicillium nalgiovense]|uniref:Ketoreductase (KR) domain-containing protein n=1 Tax=Penicillium nalgiovense TaxID=60175 RepID=A0A9W4HXJ9_PENNA|nr:unnamed protein product [Penicillium nalgiovense]CAG7962134.1 unnamed protein product [Penicillium nalgiovense]CAG7976802.1 unnamed protein product [Penicillium nalgiovense]CAG8009278.1 unnamed protein product [Penicillium nalgiovense]CAG8011537.1 unnamed protein product [Penicillium nalgiovense]